MLRLGSLKNRWIRNSATMGSRREPVKNQRAQEMIEYMKGHEDVWFATGMK
jgi:hypothetical protein